MATISDLRGARTGFNDVADLIESGTPSVTGQWTFGAGLKTDTISEKTSAAGVTIDSLLIKDGGLPNYAYSGTYTPTITNGANVASSTAYGCQYGVLENFVIVSGAVAINATTSLLSTVWNMSLPISSTFSNAQELAGTGYIEGASSTEHTTGGVRIKGDTTNNNAIFTTFSYPTSTRAYYFEFSYQII